MFILLELVIWFSFDFLPPEIVQRKQFGGQSVEVNTIAVQLWNYETNCNDVQIVCVARIIIIIIIIDGGRKLMEMIQNEKNWIEAINERSQSVFE